MRVILSAKAVWAVAKDADMAEKVRTTSIIVRKSREDMGMCYDSGTDVLGPTDAVGAGGAEDAIWCSFVSSAGWSTAISLTMS